MKLEEKEFIEICESNLPKMLRVDGIDYKLNARTSLLNTYGISYGEYDGEFFNWENKPIDLIYDIVDDILVLNGNINHMYVTNTDDLIENALRKLNAWHKGNFVELDEIVSKGIKFHRELTSLLNRYSKENGSDTPDYILATYLSNCLKNFDATIQEREKWYGRKVDNIKYGLNNEKEN